MNEILYSSKVEIKKVNKVFLIHNFPSFFLKEPEKNDY